MIIIPTTLHCQDGPIYPGTRIMLSIGDDWYMYMGLNESLSYVVLSWITNVGQVVGVTNSARIIDKCRILTSSPDRLSSYLYILTILRSRH